jgi:hypothetical protein
MVLYTGDTIYFYNKNNLYNFLNFFNYYEIFFFDSQKVKKVEIAFGEVKSFFNYKKHLFDTCTWANFIVETSSLDTPTIQFPVSYILHSNYTVQ